MTVTVAEDFRLTDDAQAVIAVDLPADPTVLRYEMRQDTTTDFGQCPLVASDTYGIFTVPLTTLLGNAYRIHAVYVSGGYSLAEGRMAFVYGTLPPVAEVTWRIDEPNLTLMWPAVDGASVYAIWVDEAGVSRFYQQNSPELRIPIPKASLDVRVIALAADGSASKPFDTTIALSGAYQLNELVTVAISLDQGTFTNMAHVGTGLVERPDLTGPSSLVFPILDVNSASLFTMVYQIASQSAASLASLPASWFRQGWWRVTDGRYESNAFDLGAVLTGVLKLSLNKTVEYHGGAVSQYSQVAADYLAEYTSDEADDQKAFVTAAFYAASDINGPWVQIADGQQMTGRYVRIVVQASEVGPLCRVRVSGGVLTLDVPDKTQEGAVTVSTSPTHVTLTGFNAVDSVIATPAAAGRVWITNRTATGFDINTDAALPVAVNYFAKGY